MNINENVWHLRMIRYTFGFTPPNLCIYFWSMVMASLMIWPVGLVKLLAIPMTPVGRRSIVGLNWRWEYRATQDAPPDNEEAYGYAIFASGLLLITLAFFLAVVARQQLDWVANLFFGLGSLAGALLLIFVVMMSAIGVWKPIGTEPKPHKRGKMDDIVEGALMLVLGIGGTLISPFVIFFAWVWAIKRRMCPIMFVVAGVAEQGGSDAQALPCAPAPRHSGVKRTR